MDERVIVDAEAIDVAATHVRLHADELNVVHGAAQERLDVRHGGFVGKSADALDELRDRWLMTAQRHGRRLEGLEGHLRSAASAFDHVDHVNAAGIQQVADGIAGAD